LYSYELISILEFYDKFNFIHHSNIFLPGIDPSVIAEFISLHFRKLSEKNNVLFVKYNIFLNSFMSLSII